MKPISLLTLITFLTINCFGMLFLSPKVAYALTPPQFIQEAETVYNTDNSPKTTASFNVLAGDVLVAYSIAENYSTALDSNDPTTIAGGTLLWTNQQTIQVNDYTWLGIWTATVDTDKSMTVSFSDPDPNRFGGNVLTFRGSDGVGTSSKNNASGGGPTLNITTTAANSAVVVANGDWSVLDGSSRTWRESDAGTLSERTYFREDPRYTVYGGYHADAGTAGVKTVGLSAPSGQKFSIAAVEVLGSEGDTTAGEPPARKLRLFEGMRMQLFEGRMKLFQ